MLMPSLFHDNFVDDFFDDMFSFPMMQPVFREFNNMGNMMSTDVQDNGDSYQLEIELPGYKKEDIHADLRNGYLTILAQKSEENDEKNDNGEYIRRERFSGKCQRSFYVGEHVKQEDVKAGFENGILKISFPKKENTPELEQKKYIAIE